MNPTAIVGAIAYRIADAIINRYRKTPRPARLRHRTRPDGLLAGPRGYTIALARTPADVPSLKNIERSIRALEGFAVAIQPTGAQRRNLPDYDYGRAARAAFTVADWKRVRFEQLYSELDVDVLRADGRVARPSMTLASLRAEYEG
jgi:hypothetical protein